MLVKRLGVLVLTVIIFTLILLVGWGRKDIAHESNELGDLNSLYQLGSMYIEDKAQRTEGVLLMKKDIRYHNMLWGDIIDQ